MTRLLRRMTALEVDGFAQRRRPFFRQVVIFGREDERLAALVRQFEDQARAHSLVQLEIPLEIRERNNDDI
jgi:hypothetical protein